MGGWRSKWVDFLKGIAILAVVLYHAGILSYGYLGVDLFLVINGYLVAKSLNSSCKRNEFTFFNFLYKRVIRLLPLVLILSFVAIVIGYFNMLPDDLENLSESVVASNVFCNNFLSSITASNYWDVSQDYKPLMHTWYLGIIVQYYVIYLLVFVVLKRIMRDRYREAHLLTLVLITVVSFGFYLICGSETIRFYFPLSRLFELSIGGFVCIIIDKPKCNSGRNYNIRFAVSWCCFALILLFIVLGNDSIPNSIYLLAVVMLSCTTLIHPIDSGRATKLEDNFVYNCIARLGIISYSIYIWHQMFYAYYRYIVNATPSGNELFALCLVILIISIISYFLLEKLLNSIISKRPVLSMSILILCCLFISGVGITLYTRAGVVRDVPELGIYTTDVHRGMHAEYNDRIYDYDKDYEDDGRTKVLVLGHSYGRDFVNVLLESDYSEILDIVYIYTIDITEDDIERVKQADYIFVVATQYLDDEFPAWVFENMKSDAELWGIGTKRYGYTVGNIYSRRNQDNYYSLTVTYEPVADDYIKEKEYFGENYIDFISPILQDNGEISAFTDDNMLISQDCKHLTQSGARYYARILDIGDIFD